MGIDKAWKDGVRTSGKADREEGRRQKRLRIRALANAIAALSDIPSGQDFGDRAYPLAKELLRLVGHTCFTAFCGSCDNNPKGLCEYHSRIRREAHTSYD